MRKRYQFSAIVSEPRLSSEINTTPLIDVMLVLLIMFILTIPVTTHKVPLDLPRSGYGIAPPAHRLAIDAGGGLSWDGTAIDRDQLAARLGAMTRDPQRPALHFSADANTAYQLFDETLAIIEKAGIERLGLVGNAQFAHWER